ncbi:hypothetical protein FRAHR75_630017 [Frankia sp. Hr75.2]|nr:hypothetical protein FRAHR75_630017 [Frankia sp. Hr75.2]
MLILVFDKYAILDGADLQNTPLSWGGWEIIALWTSALLDRVDHAAEWASPMALA